MIRRAPTGIELKFDDIREYETLRKEMAARLANKQNTNDHNFGETSASDQGAASVNVVKGMNAESKTVLEIQERIGYTSK